MNSEQALPRYFASPVRVRPEVDASIPPEAPEMVRLPSLDGFPNFSVQGLLSGVPSPELPPAVPTVSPLLR